MLEETIIIFVIQNEVIKRGGRIREIREIKETTRAWTTESTN